jgi:hypothetical protein
MESHAPQVTFHLFFFFFVYDQVHACSRLKQRLYDECGRITSGASPRLCCSFADSAALTSDRGTIFILAYSFRGVVIGVNPSSGEVTPPSHFLLRASFPHLQPFSTVFNYKSYFPVPPGSACRKPLIFLPIQFF